MSLALYCPGGAEKKNKQDTRVLPQLVHKVDSRASQMQRFVHEGLHVLYYIVQVALNEMT